MTECRVQVAALTHQGKVRKSHEDTLAVGSWICGTPMEQVQLLDFSLEHPVLCLVADGMGGHAAGEVASRYVADRFVAETSAQKLDENGLSALLHQFNRELFDRMAADPALARMGTTVAGLIVGGNRSLVFNVGDSRVYRVQDGYLAQLSTDDVAGVIPSSHTPSARSGSITQSLGGASSFLQILPHVLTDRSFPGRTYLVCSDGLTDMVSLDDMEAGLKPDLSASVWNLFEKAMAGGGEDNISILMIRIEDE